MPQVFLTRWLLPLLLLVGCPAWAFQPATDGSPFVVVVYNVENLFDVDGVALYDDYKAEVYGPKELLKKVENITKILKNFRGGKGPQIVMFEEFEADQTPSARPIDYAAFLKQYSSTTVQQMLAGSVSAEIRDLPVQAFLLKSLSDAGLEAYNVAVGEYRADPTGRTVAHVNATFSQFPITQTITHQTNGARGILEVVHDVSGNSLTTLNNHWKSGASNVDDEKIRVGNAQTLKTRIDSILKQDPAADIVVGGDFNSQYNQSVANPKMTQTAVNDIAGSQGDELALQKAGGPVLYNLWYEMPPNKRGSDVYNEQWGTLMQMMLTPGLYDFNGIQYVDNSFNVAALEGVNAQVGSRVPISWETADGQSGGFSDHLPVYAQFRTTSAKDKRRFQSLTGPGKGDDPKSQRSVDYEATSHSKVAAIKSLGSDAAIKSIDNLGQVLLIESQVSGEKPFRVKVFNEEIPVWAYDEKFRVSIYKRFPVGSRMVFLGEVGIYKGKWQFVVRDPSWLDPQQ